MDRNAGKKDDEQINEAYSGSRGGQSLEASLNRTEGATATSSASTSTSTSGRQAADNTEGAMREVITANQGLGNQIVQMIETNMDAVIETFDPKELLRKFNELSPMYQAMIVILILALLGIVTGLSWPIIAFLFKHLYNFIMSEQGTNFMANAGSQLKNFQSSGQYSSFVTEMDQLAVNPEADFSLDRSNILNLGLFTGMGTPLLTEFVKQFFNYLKRHAFL